MFRRALLLVAIVLLTGCSGLTGGHPPSDQRAVELRNQTEAYVDSVSTYRYDGKIRVYASKRDRSRSVTGDTNGSVDRRHRLFHGVSTVNGKRSESYTDGYRTYSECGRPWGGWSVENRSRSEDWLALTPLGRQMMLLERSNVYWRGNRTVDGDRTVLLVAYPSKKTLSDPSSATEADPVALHQESVKNVTVELWVDPETGQPVQSLLKVTVERGGATAVATIRLEYADYGAPVDVTVPSSVHWDQHKMGCPGS